jgi:hypothetical protein
MIRVSPTAGLFGGVAVLACGSVVLQIALTRLYSALFGHHLAFLSISLSLFGVGLGGVALYVAPWLARPPRLYARLAHLSVLASATTFGASVYVLRAGPIEALDASVLGRLALLYGLSALPFALVGLATAAAIQHAARDMSRLYLVDLVGAAAGGLVAIAALRAGAPRVGLVVALLDAIAAAMFLLGGRGATAPDGAPERRASGAAVAIALLASMVLLVADAREPFLRVTRMRWVDLGKVELAVWNELSLVTVDAPAGGMAWMRMDGSAATAILTPETTPPLHPDEMGYVLHEDRGPALVIGAGGGRDIRAALKYGQKDVDAAEINPAIVERVMGDRYRDFSGGLFQRPEVHVAIADGRSFVRRAPRAYRSIVISLVDTWAAASVGALSLSENSLYTVEAFRDYLTHLTPDGTLLVNRWDNELERLLALAAAGLRAAGTSDPAAHLFACGASRSTALLVKRAPLTPDEIAKLREHCQRNRFREAFAPDAPRTPLRQRLVALADVDEAAPRHATDLSPPTDDRPFFFYTVPARSLLTTVTSIAAMQKDNQGLLTLVGLFVVSAALGAIFLIGPLFLRRVAVLRAPDRGARLRGLAFFLAIGAGFVLVEVSLVQHLVMFLGHPVYALSTVLVSLLLWAGLGSLLSGRVEASATSRALARRGALAAALLVAYALGLGRLLEAAVGLSLPLRVVATLALVAPLGLLLGAHAPLGVRLVAARDEALVPWCWGLNGAASVVATAGGTLLAMQAGFSAVLIAGAACYAIAAAAAPPSPPSDVAATP